jgi:hypothetical protein
MAKDTSDKRTGDLLKTPNAARQAVFKERMRAEGKAQKTVWVDAESFEAGQAAAREALDTGASIQDFLPRVIAEQYFSLDGWILGFEGVMKTPKGAV